MKELRTVLAIGLDKAVLINIGDDVENVDQFTTAKVLAEYLKDKDADLIIGGNVAIDGASGQDGPRVAEALNITYVTTITKLEIDGTNVRIERDVEGDTEEIKTALTVLVRE